MEKYFEKYNLKKVGYNNEVMITKEILGIKKSPDCIIFMDDYIYNHAKPNINQNPYLKNAKIITHSSYENREKEPNTCKLIFDMDKVAKEGIELIIKLIEKKYISDFNIFISPKVENEDVLKISKTK